MYDSKQTGKLQKLLTGNMEGFKQLTSIEKERVINDIKDTISRGADPGISDTGSFQNTALIWAILYDQIELVYFLINEDIHGSSLNQASLFKFDRSVSDNTPLILSLKKGYYDIAQRLLARKEVDLNLGTTEKLSPLHLAVLSLGCTDPGFVRKPNDVFATEVSSEKIIKQGHRLIEMLIENGADIHTEDIFSKTPYNYLMQEYFLEDTYICNEILSFEQYGKELGITQNQLEEKQKLLDEFLKERMDIDEDDALSESERQEAFAQLEASTDSIITSFVNRIEQSRTAKKVIEAPDSPYKNINDIKESRKFLVSKLAKGGEDNITQLIDDYFHFHRRTNFETNIKNRNSYLITDLHHSFCRRIDDVLNPKMNFEKNSDLTNTKL